MVFVGLYLIAAYKVKINYKYLIMSCIFFLLSLLSLRFKAMMSILVILLIIYLVRISKKTIWKFIPVSVLSLVILFLFKDFFMNLTELTINRYINVSMFESARKALYQVSIWIGQNEFPFGVGFGRYGGFVASANYSPIYYEYGMSRIYGLTPDNPMWATDTYWPNIIGEIGFIGSGILLVLFVYIIIKLLINYQNLDQENTKIFVLFAGLVLIQGLIESLGEPIFNSSPQNIFIFISLGIALSILKFKKW